MTQDSTHTLDDARAALREHFGYPAFRPGQESAVESVKEFAEEMETRIGASSPLRRESIHQIDQLPSGSSLRTVAAA